MGVGGQLLPPPSPIPTALCAGIHFILIGRAYVAKIRVSSTYSRSDTMKPK